MNDAVNDVMESVRKESEARSEALHRLLSGADSAKVFGQPISSGDYTVIPAAEIAGGGGFGSGIGFGTPRGRVSGAAGRSGGSESAGLQGGGAMAAAIEGAGGGGGGGGGAMGRPVAVVVVGPDGVEVKPVIDITKLAITALGAFGAAAAISLRFLAKK